jgi:hypothetical protein
MVVGPQGPQGEPGPATVNVGTTTTSEPGSDAQVSNAGDGVNAVFDFVIPRGDVGPQGPPGTVDNLPTNIEYTDNKGVPDGYAPLDANGLVKPTSPPLRFTRRKCSLTSLPKRTAPHLSQWTAASLWTG